MYAFEPATVILRIFRKFAKLFPPMKIRIVCHSRHPLPACETGLLAGMDLRANAIKKGVTVLNTRGMRKPNGKRWTNLW